MKTDQATMLITRDSIMKQLSSEELARVATAETETKLADGEEYLDLLQLPRGVQRAMGTSVSMASTLPRRAVQDATWSRILTQLARAHVTTHVGPQ